MLLAEKDKLLHLLVCASITILIFSVISLKCYEKSKDDEHDVNVTSDQDNNNNENDVEILHASLPNTNNNERDEKLCAVQQILPTRKYIIIACISGIVAIAVGIAKEISDKYNIIVSGTASWGDILANFIGVMLGECIIVFVWFGWKLCHITMLA